jgi:hypothetical protein
MSAPVVSSTIGIVGRFVFGIATGQTLEFTGAGPGVEALGVSYALSRRRPPVDAVQ